VKTDDPWVDASLSALTLRSSDAGKSTDSASSS
jgi:hypothetical protein